MPIRRSVTRSAGLSAVPRARVLRGAIAWAGVGFIAGALFWHAIGDRTAGAGLASPHQGAGAELITGSIGGKQAGRLEVSQGEAGAGTGQNCTTLALDRGGGPTRTLPCTSEHGGQLDLGYSGRRNAMLDPATEGSQAAHDPAGHGGDAPQ